MPKIARNYTSIPLSEHLFRYPPQYGEEEDYDEDEGDVDFAR